MEKSIAVSQEEFSTETPLSVELAQELPAMAAGMLAGVVVLMLLAIATVFVLGVLLDRRQQRVIESKLRLSRQRRRNVAAADVESEAANITSHMEPSAESCPPVYASSSVQTTST